jgi:hypothetical protein
VEGPPHEFEEEVLGVGVQRGRNVYVPPISLKSAFLHFLDVRMVRKPMG